MEGEAALVQRAAANAAGNAIGNARFRQAGGDKVCAGATCAYAYVG